MTTLETIMAHIQEAVDNPDDISVQKTAQVIMDLLKLRAVIISDTRAELRRGDEPMADIACERVDNGVTIFNTPRLVVYCGHEVNTYWPDAIEDKREVLA